MTENELTGDELHGSSDQAKPTRQSGKVDETFTGDGDYSLSPLHGSSGSRQVNCRHLSLVGSDRMHIGSVASVVENAMIMIMTVIPNRAGEDGGSSKVFPMNN